MNRYLNIIIISFFSFILLGYDYGLPLLVPIILIYITYNNKLLLLMIPISIISTFIFEIELVKVTIGLYILIVIYLLTFLKKKNIVIDGIFCFASCILLLIFKKYEFTFAINKESLYLYMLYSLAGTIFYIIIKSLLNSSEGNFVYFEVLSISVALIGASQITFTYNIGFILALIYAIYFTYNTSTIFSLVFSIGMMAYLFFVLKIDYALILPVISVVYSLNSIVSSFLIVLLTTVICVIYPKYYEVALIIDGVCIAFEILKTKLLGKKITKDNEIKETQKETKETLNQSVLAFSSFLDMCASESEGTREYYKKIDEGINSLITNYCNKCYLANRCQRSDIKEEMKYLIINANSLTYDLKESSVFSVCPYNVEIRKSAMLIYEKIEDNKTKSKTKVVSSTLSGISNILRQFTVDNNLKVEIPYEDIYRMKKSIASNGYTLVYFKIKKLYEEEFLIEVGIRGFTFEDIKERLSKIISHSFKREVTLEYDYSENGKVYFRVIPKTSCKIEYSTSQIASGNISGDNVLISETKDGKVVSVICDGMGKGYSASLSSEFVIRMFEELFKSTLSSYAIIQMMNTYCEIKDSIDSFCTLDYMELDRKNKALTFYKMSSAPSYVFHKDKTIEKVENKRLPLGKESEILTDKVKIEEGDIIVMSSDGIFDNIKNESELNDYISSITHLPAPKIVYQIINYIKEINKLTDDDISLVVLKVLPS